MELDKVLCFITLGTKVPNSIMLSSSLINCIYFIVFVNIVWKISQLC